MVTSKKQKIVGIQEFIDSSTGEVVPMQVVSVEDRDFNFHKIWMQHFINSLDSISNQKLRLAFWIIDHLNKENQLVMTQRQIAKAAEMSIKTVSRTMLALQEGDCPFLVKLNTGAYVVNPNILYKGSHTSRMGIIYDYNNAVEDSDFAEKKAKRKEKAEKRKAEKAAAAEDEVDPDQMTVEDLKELDAG